MFQRASIQVSLQGFVDVFSGTSEPYWAVGRFKGMDGFWVSVLELEDSPRWPKALGCKGLHFTVAGFHVMFLWS